MPYDLAPPPPPPPPTARDELLALLPLLREEDIRSLVHEVKTWLRARKELHERLGRERLELANRTEPWPASTHP